jgi:hypothetical protein
MKTRETIIRELREMLCSAYLTQSEYETICAAIRELGGRP